METKNIKSYSHVLGPVSLTEHYSEEYKKHIYIFGDIHTDEHNKECKGINIAKFLKKVVETNPDKKIDIFLEMPLLKKDVSVYQKNEPTAEQGFLFGDVALEFIDCLQIDKSKCKYDNLRLHYVDVRQYNKNINHIVNYLNNFLLKFAYIITLQYDLEDRIDKLKNNISYSELLEEIKNLDKFRDLYAYLSIKIIDIRKTLEILGVTWSSKIYKNLKIIKQLDNVENPTIVSAINRLLNENNEDGTAVYNRRIKLIYNIIKFINEGDELFYNLATEVDSLLGNIDKGIDIDSKKIVNVMISGYKSIITLFSETDTINMYDDFNTYRRKTENFQMQLMDTYTLARIFRSFKSGDDPSNIIIYAGDEHSENYRKFLKLLNFKLVAEAQVEDKCLPLSKFKQPFFS